jgi:hypothetical protein
VLAGLGLSGSGLAAGLVAWKPVLIALSALSLALSHWFVWRKHWGGRATRVVLLVATVLAPILWCLPIGVH